MTLLADLQVSLKDTTAFGKLEHYFMLCHAFLTLVQETQPTRIISPTNHNYIFYQYDETYRHRITRPLNINLFFESAVDFKTAFTRLVDFLADLKKYQAMAVEQHSRQGYLDSNEINRVIYTI